MQISLFLLKFLFLRFRGASIRRGSANTPLFSTTPTRTLTKKWVGEGGVGWCHSRFLSMLRIAEIKSVCINVLPCVIRPVYAYVYYCVCTHKAIIYISEYPCRKMSGFGCLMLSIYLVRDVSSLNLVEPTYLLYYLLAYREVVPFLGEYICVCS